MKKTQWWCLAAVLAVQALVVSGGTRADEFSCVWFTVDAGGITGSTGGAYELGGTIAQPDAGRMSGGPYEVTGGFWPGFGGHLLGDTNCDGFVDLEDLIPFATALVDSAAYEALFPECNLERADMNADGTIDGADVQMFIDVLLGR